MSRSVPLSRVGRRLGIGLLVLVVGFVFVWPVVMLLVGAFRSAPPGLPSSWTASAVGDTFGDAATWRALRNSVGFAVASTVLAGLIGGFLAFLSTRTTVPLRWMITPLMILVLVAPNVLYAISWALLADPNTGLVNSAFRELTGGEGTLLNAYSWTALIAVQALKLSSFAYLLLLGPFSAMSRVYEEASLMVAGRARTLLRIDLPLLTPSLFGVAIIGAVFGMGAFDIPQILGDPAGIEVISTQIYKKLNASVPPQYAQASMLGMFMIAALVILLVVQWRMLRVRSFVTVTGKNYRQDRWNLGRWGYPCTAVIVLFAVVALVLPGIQLVLTSLQPAIGVNRFSFDNYRAVLSSPLTTQVLQTTAWLAVVGGLLAMVLATVIGYVARHSHVAVRRFLDSASLVPLAMPGVVLAVGLLWAYVTTPGLRELYATFWLALLGLVVVVTPIASRAVSGALAQVSGELEEAAAVSGASRVRVLRDVIARLVAPSFVAGWLMCGVIIAGTLDVPLLLLPTTSPNVAVQVYGLMNSAGRPTEASALLVVLMVAVAGAALAFLLVSRIGAVALRRWRAAAVPKPEPAETGERQLANV